ncbi:CRAL TRIO domain protein [Seminavis robusta]|uniref:CRAL TRIO domain protein n=1 Tax=Seminavis robusta TaxID=568900 RepID=A0A9N8HMT0_9STRA|nr:CRAL TRIO domain protein [Seminavis robusta]|eukprot:Sro769_g199840.1 CRAL TRIO domain protein (342) ;mRNA; r:33096-34121
MASCTVTPLLAGSCNGPFILTDSPRSSMLLDVLSSPEKLNLPLPLTDEPQRRRSLDYASNVAPETLIKLDWMLSHLTQKELETAANASYEYLQDPDAYEATLYARQIALRYLRSKKGNAELALRKLQTTLAFREQVDMDGLRQAFDESPWSSSNPYRAPLEQYLSSGKNYVRCYDREGRSTHIFVPRKTVHHHDEWTLKETYYTMERAIACSQAKDSSVNAILDFAGFNPVRNAPPMSLGKTFVLTMRQHFAGHIHKIFIVDAPSSFAFLWKIFQPFLGKATQDKIVFVSGTKQKEKILGAYYEPHQATTWMLPDTGLQTKEFDVQEYLYKTPFNQAFDER